MRGLDRRGPRFAGLLALALGAVAMLALAGGALAKDHHGDDHGRHGDDHGHHGRHGDDHGRHHHHHHRFFEMEEAGTITSFDATTGKLTITLTGGEVVTGLVTAETRIECEGIDDRFDRRDHGGGDDNGGGGPGPSDGSGSGGSNGSGSTPGGPGPVVPGPAPEGEGEGMPGDGAPAPGEGTCKVASLVPGAVVGEAELRLERGAAMFEEIELGHEFDHDS